VSAWVIGFDLSLTAPAAVVLPQDWKPGDWKRVRAHWCKPTAPKSSADLHGQLKRFGEIAQWAISVVASLPRKDVEAYVEDYGYHQGMVAAIKESGGIVKHELFVNFQLVLQPVTSSEARKLSLGFNPRKPKHDAKVVVQDTVFNKFGAPKTWTEDVCDAFLIAQFGLADRDGKILMLPPPTKPKR
jgi:hypothetical protein